MTTPADVAEFELASANFFGYIAYGVGFVLFVMLCFRWVVAAARNMS